MWFYLILNELKMEEKTKRNETKANSQSYKNFVIVFIEREGKKWKKNDT